MRRAVRWLLVLVGLGLVGLGAVLAVVSPGGERGVGTWALVGMLALFALALALWKAARSVDRSDGIAPLPWSAEGGVDPAPERGTADHPLSGEALADVVEVGGSTARSEGTVEDGLAVVRGALRPVLRSILVRGGADREAAERTIRSGAWTDDAVAASVLEESVVSPRRSLWARSRAWLFPERVVRDRTRRAVGAMAEAADEQLPAIVGQGVPREMPVAPPTLQELRRGADGELQASANRPAGGPPDRSPTVTVDDRTRDGEPAPAAEADRNPPAPAADSSTDRDRPTGEGSMNEVRASDDRTGGEGSGDDGTGPASSAADSLTGSAASSSRLLSADLFGRPGDREGSE